MLDHFSIEGLLYKHTLVFSIFVVRGRNYHWLCFADEKIKATETE